MAMATGYGHWLAWVRWLWVMDQTCISRKQQKILQADSFSWRRTLRLPKLRGTILWPWFLLTILSISVVVLQSLLDEHIQIPSEAAVTLGTVSGLLLAFRLQAAYNKWWEARCLWGEVIKVSRILLSELLSNIDDAEPSGRDGIVLETAAWCLLVAVSLKHHLRTGGKEGAHSHRTSMRPPLPEVAAACCRHGTVRLNRRGTTKRDQSI